MFVYFAKVTEAGEPHVKIGKARSVPKRLREHRHGSAATTKRLDVELLAAVRANGDTERYLQRHFNCDRIDGENFRGSDDLLSYVRWMRDQYFVAIDEDSCRGLQDTPFDQWSPADNLRRISERVVGMPLFSDKWEFSTPNYTPDDYHTPSTILKPVKAFIGIIDVDPASHPHANKKVGARVFYTRETNGLSQQWYGKVWLNPPFSQYSDFTKKMIYELDRGRIVELVALHALGCMSALYMQPVLARCDAKLLIAGRHNHDGLGQDKQSCTGHGLLYFGSRTTEFAKHFRNMGTVWTPTPE